MCDHDDAIMYLSSSFGRIKPETGLSLSDQISNMKLRDSYSRNLGSVWAYHKPAEAQKWLVDRIQESDYSSNRQIAEGIIHQIVQWDHGKALLAIEAIPDLLSRDEAMLAALNAYSHFDPAAAASRISAYTNNDNVRPESMEAVVSLSRNWLDRDPLAASAWIRSLGAGPVKDASIGVLVENILVKDKDMALAIAWAAQISDPQKKRQVNEKIEKSQP
jgi:hypothetical protein